MPTLHVHLDESGDLNFSPTGSKYYVFAAAWTYQPVDLAHILTQLRFYFVKKGHDLSRFHAAEDAAIVRTTLFDYLIKDKRWKYAAVVVEKSKVAPALCDAAKFYTSFGSMPLRFVFRGPMHPNTKTILIYNDHPPSQIEKKHRDLIAKAIKTAARNALPPDVKFHTYHHPSTSNAWLQIADYCCWAVFRKWESEEPDPYRLLLPRLAAPELDVLAGQKTRYY